MNIIALLLIMAGFIGVICYTLNGARRYQSDFLMITGFILLLIFACVVVTWLVKYV